MAMPVLDPLPWNLKFVAADDAWARLPQAGSAIDWGALRVAHLDTGYSFHPAMGFAGVADPQPGDLGPVIVGDGGDFYDLDRSTAFDPLDPFELTPGCELQPPGHGTFSGSMLSGWSAEDAFSGVAPGLPLVALRITDGSVLLGRRAVACAEAINAVVADALAPVVNISVGAVGEHPRIRAALNRAYEAGIIVVAAAGQIIQRVVYPARYARAISVGGIRLEQQGAIRRYRVYAPYDDYRLVDVWAPAGPLRRAHVERPGTPGAGYAYGYFGAADGTTYACTHATAAAALWLRHHGAAIETAYGVGWKRIEGFRKLLRNRTINVPRISDRDRQRLGAQFGKTACLNLDRLLNAPLPPVAESDMAGIQR